MGKLVLQRIDIDVGHVDLGLHDGVLPLVQIGLLCIRSDTSVRRRLANLYNLDGAECV